MERGGGGRNHWNDRLVAWVGGGLLGWRFDGPVRDNLLLEMEGEGSERMESFGVVG